MELLEASLLDFEEELEAQESESVPSEFFDNFSEDIRELVKHYISSFFADKEMHYGGPISENVLHLPHYVNVVLNTDICDGVDRAHEMLSSYNLKTDVPEGLVPEDVRLVVSVLNQCARAKIPKAFAAGIVLMYLELCEGVEADEK